MILNVMVKSNVIIKRSFSHIMTNKIFYAWRACILAKKINIQSLKQLNIFGRFASFVTRPTMVRTRWKMK